jgi:hypothetical protein
MYTDKWNEICFLLNENIRHGISESDFELNVVQALRVLDWKEFSGDIKIRPSFQIGASNRLTPDIVVNSREKKNLFVIEIKQPDLPISIEFQKQLFSYMRQLRLEYGLLVGQVIQIFYDGDLTDNDEPILLETLEYKRDSTKGEKFVELFSKQTFSYDLLNSFTSNALKKINRIEDHKKLLQKILSKEYQLKLEDLIKQDFLANYDSELIDNVLKEISINITPINQLEIKNLNHQVHEIDKSENNIQRDKTKYSFKGTGIVLPKNRFVLELVRVYLKKHPSDFTTLKNIFKDEYQGSTGVINRLDFVNNKYANKSNKRHFTGKDEILISKDNVQFVVSTEWGKHNVRNIVNIARKIGFEIEEV